MARQRGRRVTAVRRAVVLMGCLAAWSGSGARGDRIVLRGGGQVRGKVLPGTKPGDRVSVLAERGKTPLSFRKEQIAEIVPEPGPLDDYLPKKAAAAATAEAQYELGLWCERNKLPDLASLHYQAALAHDKSFAPAHKKLGHSLYAGQWLTSDAVREAQGLVRLKGKWVTKEHREQHARESELAAEQASWARRARLLLDAVHYGAPDRRGEAEAQLLAIRDRAAVVPLMRVLGTDPDASVRGLLARVLGFIPGPEATAATVHLLLDESDPDVRGAAVDELAARKDADVTKRLVRALRSSAPEVVNRAAWALGILGEVAAVPSLVGSLVTTRFETVMGPNAETAGAGGSSFSATFGSVAPSPTIAGGALMGYNGSSAAYLTGPVVGPGVAAFGAVGVPLYGLPSVPSPISMLPNPGAPSLAGTPIAAGGGVNGTRGPMPRVVAISVENAEVHAALVKLTGRDFGFEVDAWRRWVRTSFQPEHTPARRAPQP